MPRKRSRSIQKNQHQMGRLPIADAGSNVLGHNPKSNYFFSVPGCFQIWATLLGPQGPTMMGRRGDGGSSKVGLSIIDSLNDDVKVYGKVSRSSESKNILFGPDMRIKTPDS
ncbi:unnamed protein product [Prunus armeniaca]|uniref:Uncharacterized protein n=1 Tax=Prunus armeniaca TaxID=36596 RepID=A0A6J5TDG4_PRUAR|nr:unnamed protein product [Prunus armeniaca]